MTFLLNALVRTIHCSHAHTYIHTQGASMRKSLLYILFVPCLISYFFACLYKESRTKAWHGAYDEYLYSYYYTYLYTSNWWRNISVWNWKFGSEILLDGKIADFCQLKNGFLKSNFIRHMILLHNPTRNVFIYMRTGIRIILTKSGIYHFIESLYFKNESVEKNIVGWQVGLELHNIC